MPAAPFGEPVADQFGLMARGIVHDDVNVEIGGDMLFDGVEEAAEFLRPVARHAFADDGSGLSHRARQRARSSRAAYSRGCAVRLARVASAAAAGCDPAPGSAISHRRRAPARGPAG